MFILIKGQDEEKTLCKVYSCLFCFLARLSRRPSSLAAIDAISFSHGVAASLYKSRVARASSTEELHARVKCINRTVSTAAQRRRA